MPFDGVSTRRMIFYLVSHQVSKWNDVKSICLSDGRGDMQLNWLWLWYIVFYRSRFHQYFTALRYASAVYAVVCLSVTCRHCTKTVKRRIRQTTPYVRWSRNSSFADLKHHGKIPTGSPSTGAPNKCGVGSNWRFSTIISLYLRNGAR